MYLTGYVEEDFIQYKTPSLFLSTSVCNKDCPGCQNRHLKAEGAAKYVDNKVIIQRYLDNPITHAVVLGGLDPLDSIKDLEEFCLDFREASNDPIVIYTGYEPQEVADILEKNDSHIWGLVIFKFGRYIHDTPPRYDEILGVELASHNQHAYHYLINKDKDIDWQKVILNLGE